MDIYIYISKTRFFIKDWIQSIDMISTQVLLDLIVAFKGNNPSSVDDAIKQLIENAEKRKHHKLAKSLRELYAKPNSHSGNLAQTSSVPLIVNDESDLFEIRHSKINLDNIVLSETNKRILLEIIDNYKNKEVLRTHGLTNDSRLILHGPPGTGKTLSAYVIAGELGIPVVHVYLDSLVSSYLGETGKNLKQIFQCASKQQCVLLLDEFDAIAKHRDDGQELGELKRVVTVLLQNIDELNPDTVLIAATNHHHLLDPAVWRRFDYSIKMDVLDSAPRKIFIAEQLDGKKVDLNLLTSLTEGLSGAVIKQVINRSLRQELIGKSAQDFQKDIVINFLTIYSKDKKNKDNELIKKAVKFLREKDKTCTYDELERLTGVPSSTLHYLHTK